MDFPFLKGGGDMGEFTRNFEWSQTSVGSPDKWPKSLQTTVGNILRSRFPMFLWWGPEMIQFYNDAYRPSLGNNGKHPKALGAKGKECWPEIWDIISPLHKQVEATGEATWMEDQLVPIFRNGKIEDVYWTFSYSSVLNDEGIHGGILVTCMETTAAVNASKETDNNIQELLRLFEESPVAIATIKGKDDLVFQSANAFYSELVGRKSKDIIGKPLLEALPELKDQGFDILLKEVFSTGKPYMAKEISAEIFRGGIMETIYVDLIYQPRIQSDGKTTGILVVATDVTEQVRARKKIELQAEDLQKQQRLYEAVTANTPDLIYIFDLEYRFIFANKALLTMWGRTLEDSIGKKLLEVGYEPWHAEMHEREIDYVVATRLPIRGEVSFPHAVLGKRIYDYLFVPVINNEGQVEAIAGTTRDITEIKMAEESLKLSETQLQFKVTERTAQLERTVTELKRSNNNLEEFAYAASHDLKEPIRKIHVFSDMLKADLSSIMTEEQLYNLSRLQAASKRMSSLIDDILTYSQLNFPVASLEKVNLNDILKIVLNDLDLQIEQTSAVIEAGELNEIEGYSRQIQQAFHNLISNSIKYRSNDHSPLIKIEGKMIMGNETGLTMTAEQKEKKYYLLQFEDNGIGFNKEDAERIFNIFTRLHNSAQYKGTGIGLSIVRKVVENHKGFVIADSDMGKGSIFKLFFPV